MIDTIRQAIQTALVDLGLPPVEFVVDYPTDKTAEADFFSNVALVVAGQAGQPPRMLAEQLQETLGDGVTGVTSISVAGPGFLNFTVDRSFYTAALDAAVAAGDQWGRNQSWAGQTVLVEYTDPNPFKEFHVGHLFTNAVGESLARLFMMNGADTKRINYQGDVGLHVAHAIYGMQQLGIEAGSGFTAGDLGKAYAHGATAYKGGGETIMAIIRDINKKVYDRSDEAINTLYDAGRQVSLAYFETIYARVGTQFDDYFYESEASPRGKELVESNPDIFPESDGARIFDGEAHGLHTRVFLNKEGLPTYEAKELALANLKRERLGEYDHSVISTANEITEYFKVLLKAMSFVYPDLAAKTEHIGHGTVRLTTGKMSSRTGDVIPAFAFIDDISKEAHQRMVEGGHVDDPAVAEQVAIAAIKYATLKGNILQDTIFNPEQALSFEGDSGPYLQYTYARIQSVLEKAAEAGVTPATTTAPAVPYEVERVIERFPSVIAIALEERAPHHVVTYLTELAGTFNTFYATEKIADSTDEYAPHKAAVADVVARTLRAGLFALGIEAPERM